MSNYKHNYIYIILLANLTWACGDSKLSETAEGNNSDTTRVTLALDQIARAGIKTGDLQEKDLSRYIETNGYFDVPPQNKAEVSSYKPGYVKMTNLLVGDRVQKDQILVVLENPEFIKTQQEYMEVKGQLDYLKAEYERKKVLESEKITAQRSLQKAQADYNSSLARYQGLKKELQMMGINTTQLEFGNFTSTMAIRSPIKGSVTKINANIGKYLLPQQVIVEVVDHEHLHVELEVFEKDASKVAKGQKFWMRVPSLSDQRYEGEIYLVGKSLDLETRTVHVHGHVPEEPDFVPGMYVEAGIIIESKTASAVPAEAVISQGSQHYVFVPTETNSESVTYEKIPVKTGLSSDEWIEVTPITPGIDLSKVVFSGGYYLSSSLKPSGSTHSSH